MALFDLIFAYYNVLESKCDSLIRLRNSDSVRDYELLVANNQLLSDLINLHAKSDLLSQYVSLNSELFDKKIAYLFGEQALVKEIIKVGSNLSDYFGYCGFCSDSLDIHNGFSLVIDKKILAFSHNDVRAFSDLVSRNIRFQKVVSQPTKYDPSYQLPTYSLLGVNFNIVPVQDIKYPYIEF